MPGAAWPPKSTGAVRSRLSNQLTPEGSLTASWVGDALNGLKGMVGIEMPLFENP